MIRATTELDAINIMLGAVGEAPLAAVDAEHHSDAAMARNVLHQASKEVQTEGWFFNTETNYPLVPDTSGEIHLPENFVNVETEPYACKGGIDPVQRGTRLYDRAHHTYTFKGTLRATVVLLLPFEELPEVARNYIALVAARRFQAAAVGSESLYQFTQVDETKARANLIRQQVKDSDSNLLSPGRKSTFGMLTIPRITDRRI